VCFSVYATGAGKLPLRSKHMQAKTHFKMFCNKSANLEIKLFNLLKPTGHVMHQQFNFQ